jgi:hypothetical protein
VSEAAALRFRVAVAGVLVVAWAVSVYYMWDALTTVPSAERLQQTRMVAIPTPRSFFMVTAFSAMELAVVLAVVWPWLPSFYASRLAAGVLGLVTWFITTIPMEVSDMDRVHRRWLVFTALALLAALVLLLLWRGAAWVRARAAADADPS